jgi:hypothetical protein
MVPHELPEGQKKCRVDQSEMFLDMLQLYAEHNFEGITTGEDRTGVNWRIETHSPRSLTFHPYHMKIARTINFTDRATFHSECVMADGDCQIP